MGGEVVQQRGDTHIAPLAESQYGLITRAQLLAAGITRRQIDGRVKRGGLIPVHRGVFAVGHRPRSAEARWVAAALACGGAVVSHRDAAGVWKLLARRQGAVHVTVARGSGRRAGRGIRLHRVSLHPADITRRHRIPVTTPARTLIDIAPGLTPRALERATDEARYLGLITTASLHQALERNRHRPGAGMLRALLRRHQPGTTRTRTGLEEALLGICRDAGLPQPHVNAVLERLEVDFLWPTERLVVETDGYGAHHSRAALERDHARDALLGEAGYRVRRFTDREVAERPLWVAATLRRLLTPKGW